jgi:diamine N-acetyltransferase
MLSDEPVNQFTLSGYQVELLPMTQAHQSQMRSWRNQDEIRQQMLSDEMISEEQQQAWFKKTRLDPKQLHWVIKFRDQLIGATNVKSLETGKTAEQASLLEPGLYIGERRYQGNIVAFAPTLAMYDFCFEQLGTKRFRAVVKRSNQNALSYNQKLGYKIVEDNALSVLELDVENYRQATAPIKQFLSRTRNAK